MRLELDLEAGNFPAKNFTGGCQVHQLTEILLIGSVSAATLWSIYTSVVTICSFLHTTLPPWDFLKDFPRAQAVYKVLVYIIGYIALNARSTVYKSISANGNAAVPKQ